MRRLIALDVIDAVAALDAIPKDFQQIVVSRWLREAHSAHRYWRYHGKPHPAWGNGSLSARVRGEQTLPPLALSVPALLSTVQLVLAAVMKDRAERGSHIRPLPDWP